MKGRESGDMPELLPWRRERSFVKSISSLPPKTAKLGQVRSKPKAAGHRHLEIYLRSMEKARLSTLGEAYARLLKGAVAGWERADAILRGAQDGSSDDEEGGKRRTPLRAAGPDRSGAPSAGNRTQRGRNAPRPWHPGAPR